MSNERSNPSRGGDRSAAEKATAERVAKTVPILLHRDYWDEEGARHGKGSVAKVDVATARTLIGEGKGDRADPLPGEGER